MSQLVENPMVRGRMYQRWDVGAEVERLGRCEYCGESLYRGYEAKRFEHRYFCDEFCFSKYMGLVDVGA